MSGASDIGIRISLEGGKEAAVQATAVADSLKGVGDAAKGAGAGAVTGSGGIDTLTASFGKLDESGLVSIDSMRALARQGMLTSLEVTATMGRTQLVLDKVAESERLTTTSTTWMGTAFGLTGAQADKVTSKFQNLGKAVAFSAVAAGAIVAYETSKMALAYETTSDQIAASANITVGAANKVSDAFLHTTNSVTFNAQAIATAFAPVAGQLDSITHGAVNASTSMMLMNATMNLATASGEDLASATSSVTDILQAFGFAVDQADTVSNILYNTSRLTSNSTTSLASTIDRLHSRLGQVMPSLADTAGLMYDLAKNGASGSRGTLMVSGALTTLLGGGAAVNSMLEKIGLSTTSFYGPNGKFIGMAAAIALLQPRLADLGQRQQLLAEKTLFGSGAAETMGQVVLKGAAAYDAYRAAIVRHNAVQEAAAKVTKSLSGQVDLLKKDFHNAGIDIGQFVLPKLVAIGKWMSQHKSIVVALAAVIGTVLVGAIVAWGFSMLVATADLVGLGVAMTASGIGVILALVGVLVIAAMHWKQIWSGMKNDFDAVWGWIKKILHNDFVLALMGPVGALIFLGEHWKTVWHGIMDVVRFVWNWMKPIINQVKDAIRIVGDAVHVVSGIIGGIGHVLGFAEGGVVPGPVGAPMMALVHGGEAIVPPQNIYNASGSSMSPTMLGQAASKITPGSANSSTIPSQVISNNGGGSGQPTIIQLVVDRKVLAELVVQEIQNQYARR